MCPDDCPPCEDLIEAIGRSRDRRAFELLVEHYGPRIHRYLLGLRVGAADAEDVAQECLLAVWRRASRFDRDRASGTTWLFTIARNRWIDRIRRERRPVVDLADPATVLPEPDPGERTDARRQAGRVRDELAGLPPEQAETLRRAYFQGQTMQEIARATGTPLGTVKSRIRLALARLRANLARFEGTE